MIVMDSANAIIFLATCNLLQASEDAVSSQLQDGYNINCYLHTM